MINLDVINLPNEYLPDMNWVTDLQYFDGALMSHFSNKKGNDYIARWVDCNDTIDRWLFSRVSNSDITLLMSQSISIRELVCEKCKDKYCLMIDMNDDIHIETGMLLNSNIPEEYLPEHNIFININLIP